MFIRNLYCAVATVNFCNMRNCFISTMFIYIYICTYVEMNIVPIFSHAIFILMPAYIYIYIDSATS